MKIINKEYFNKLSQPLKENIKRLESIDLSDFCWFENSDEGYVSSEAYNFPNTNKINVYSGATKIVWVDEDCDYVVKMPIPYIMYGDYNEESGEYDYDSGEWTERNYIDEEIKFRRGYHSEFQPILAENILVCVVEALYGRTLNIYVQDRCDEWNLERNIVWKCSPRSKSTATKLIHKYNYYRNDWMTIFVENNGRKYAKKFMQHLQTIDGRIPDLHGGNYATRVRDGKAMIIDYGGYSGLY